MRTTTPPLRRRVMILAAALLLAVPGLLPGKVLAEGYSQWLVCDFPASGGFVREGSWGNRQTVSNGAFGLDYGQGWTYAKYDAGSGCVTDLAVGGSYRLYISAGLYIFNGSPNPPLCNSAGAWNGGSGATNITVGAERLGACGANYFITFSTHGMKRGNDTAATYSGSIPSDGPYFGGTFNGYSGGYTYLS